MEEPVFWADQLARDILEEQGEKDSYVFNSGMSVSGKMHIGNLRGELMIPSRVRHILEEGGKEVDFLGVYYTQDRFKSKQEQLEQFDDPEEAEKYEGWRLIDVPDPEGCHDNWVEHFNEENHPYLSDFGIDVETLTTTEFYTWGDTKELVRRFLDNRERVRNVLNEFRERNPYPEDWIPFDPLCTECNRIDSTEALEVDLEDWEVRYRCENCGAESWSDMEEGKLGWRLEWSALWHVLEVDFEPYGKDHATPGGSRDSCVALAKEFDLDYPAGFSFNWVYLKDGEDIREMTSSGDVGITAQEYLEFSAPEVLAFVYMSNRPMSEIYFSPRELPTHYRRFDRAERVYFGNEDMDDEKREMNLERVYELAVLDPPEEQPVRVEFDHAAFVAQTIPPGEWGKEGLEKLRDTGHVPEEMSERDRERVLERLERARNWARDYAPEDHLYEFNEEVPEEVVEGLSSEQLAAIRDLVRMLEENDYSSGGELEDDLFELARDSGVGVGEFFQASYLCLLSREDGPRLADFILTRGQEEVLNVLRTVG
ncbi:MAG: lysine--tRNA ligase [Candidatus Nanohaloarchaeota archaeon QJJ-7]|nr:lysine--tRNA ligase [Candidatus Nanohaloarchaeota archaeon QJJ-7]